MDLLLDTHTLVWFFTRDSKLSESLRLEIKNEGNQSYVSIASLWEIGVKYALKKIELKKNLSDFFNDINSSDLKIQSVTPNNILQLASLPFHHRDPFDRLIIAQAMTEDYAIVTKDREFSAYDVNVIWH